MQIQLVGVPASGKTTLGNILINLYPEKYVLATKQYCSFSKFVFFNPLFFVNVFLKCLPILPLSIKSVMSSKVNKTDQFLAIAGLLMYVANYLYYTKNKVDHNKIIIWDELLLQRGLSIFAYTTKPPKNKAINKYIKWALKNSEAIPVCIFCKEAEQLKRLKQRGAPKRMEAMDNELLTEVLKVQTLTLKTISDYMDNSLFLNSSDNAVQDAIQLDSQLDYIYA